jgi:HEPN domain-containing protein
LVRIACIRYHVNVERSRDWMDQAEGDLKHARSDNAHPSGSPRTRYTEGEARRLIGHAERIIEFCADLLSKV